MGRVRAAEWLLLAVLLVLGYLGTRLLESRADRWLLLTALSGVAAAFWLFLRRKRLAHLPWMSDGDFVQEYMRRYARAQQNIVAPEEKIIAARRLIAKALGVPSEKLTPDVTIAELGDKMEFFGSYSVGFSDLEDHLMPLFQEAGAAVPDLAAQSIGETISCIVATEG